MTAAFLVPHSLVMGPAAMSSDWAGWVPSVSGQLFGTVPSAATVVVEVASPDGEEWLTLTVPVDPTDEDAFTAFEAASYEGEHARDWCGSLPVRARLVSELEGVDTLLYEGSLDVAGTDGEYMVDADWLLDQGTLALDIASDADAPRLHVTFWVSTGTDGLGAYLFHDGRKVAASDADEIDIVTWGRSVPATASSTYQEVRVECTTVPGWLNCEYDNSDEWHVLAANPGRYELKLLQENALLRTIPFEVGADGTLCRTGDVTADTTTGLAMLWSSGAAGGGHWPGSHDDWGIEAMYGSRAVSDEDCDGGGGGSAEAPGPRVVAAVEDAEKLERWYAGDFEAGTASTDDCDGALTHLDGLLPTLASLVAESGPEQAVSFQDEPSTLGAVQERMLWLEAQARGGLQAEADADEASLAPFLDLLRNDKLEVARDRPPTEYRYYTSGKRLLDTPQAIAEAETWCFEGAANQGYLDERWSVVGFHFDADQNLVDRYEESGFGGSAPSSAFRRAGEGA